MPNQETINKTSDQIILILEKAKQEITEDLLKIKEKVTDDEFIQVLNKMDLKGILNAKIDKAKQLYIAQHKVVLEETIPFGDISGDRWTNIRIILRRKYICIRWNSRHRCFWIKEYIKFCDLGENATSIGIVGKSTKIKISQKKKVKS